MIEKHPFFLFLMRLLYKNKIRFVTDRAKSRDTRSTLPYVTGHTFREISDHIIDDTRIAFFPNHVKEGDVIFLKTKYLRRFVKYMHPQIRNRYILITHYGDEEVPGEYHSLLEEEKVIRWFGMNTTKVHPKLTPIPIGIRGKDQVKLLDHRAQKVEKKELLHLNFNEATHPERIFVKQYFSSQPFCNVQPRKENKAFLTDLQNAKFTLSPRGNGIDCHRTWESLAVGTIPVIRSTPLDPLFEGLPVVIIKEWTDVTEKFLEQQYQALSLKTYNLDKLYMDYWTHLIQQAKRASL